MRSKETNTSSRFTRRHGAKDSASVYHVQPPPTYKSLPSTTAASIGSIPTSVWFIGFVVSFWFHLSVAPYTKVEESFNLQAIHDLIFHGPLAVDRFDHREFPGPVRRTFVGAVGLWLASLPIALPAKLFSKQLYTFFNMHTKIAFQYLVRGVIALIVAVSLAAIHAASRRVHGHIAAAWFAVWSLVQFHLTFWGSRTLPNIFALVLFNHAFAAWISSAHEHPANGDAHHVTNSIGIPSSSKRLISLLIFAAVVFRAEIALPFFIIVLSDIFITRRYLLVHAFTRAVVSGIASLLVVVIVDAFFWNSFIIWPELESFIFNVVENKSVEWGVLPIHAYFTFLLPRIAPASYPIAAVSAVFLWSTQHIRQYVLLVLGFVGAYSLLGHKEWRFVIYMLPVINLMAGIGIARLYAIASKSGVDLGNATPRATSPSKSREQQPVFDRVQNIRRIFGSIVTPTTASWIILFFKALAIMLACVSLGMLYISHLNYPGGVAFNHLHTLIAASAPSDASTPPYCHVHIDVYSAMTGVSRFGERSDVFPVPCTYSKNESHVDAKDYVVAGYTHLLTSEPEKHLGNNSHWIVLESIQGLVGVKLLPLRSWATNALSSVAHGRFWELNVPISVVMEPKVFILGRM